MADHPPRLALGLQTSVPMTALETAEKTAAPVDALAAGLALERARRPAQALDLYLAAARARPKDPALKEAAARAALAARQLDDAVTHAKAGLKLDRNRTALRFTLAVALMEQNQLAQAEKEAARLVEQTPADLGAVNLLGVIQKRLGRMSEAVETFGKATDVDPSSHSAWYNLGNTLLAAGRHAEAVEPLSRALDLKVDCSETARLVGQAWAGAGRHGLALAAFDRAEKLDPNNRRVFSSRALALQSAGSADAVVLAELDRVITLEPENLEHQRAKAIYLQRRSRFDEAEQVNRAILEQNPDDLETLLRLGHMLGYSLRRYEEANAFLRRAVALRPEDPRCLSGLCKSLLDSRYGVESDHIQEAGEVAKRLLTVNPDIMPLAANLISVFLRLADFDAVDAVGDRSKLMAHWVERMNVGSLHNQLGRVVTMEDRHELVHWHRQWGLKVAAQAAKFPIRRPARPARRDRIRVAFMSSDLRNHPVAYFALPIFEHFDPSKFELAVYSFYPSPADSVQKFIEGKCVLHRSMLQATDQEIAQQIADDNPDILFELGGSTRYNRLDVLAYKAARTQVSWLGYPHSAGIAEIDHILTDPYLEPEDKSLLIEQPFRMPESWVVLGKLGFRDVPIEPGIPEDRAGHVTFGTMNNPYKYTRETFARWAAVMNRVEGSRFLFVRPEAGAASFRENIGREFAEHGVSPDRLEFESVRGRHLPHYNRIDIALDTAPQTGGTTTCESLWMGVPTVTLVGPAFFERLSYSNLSNAGLGDLCAFDADQFVEIAAQLAADRERRLELRHGLRAQIRSAPLGDEARWVRNFEASILKTLGAS
jgi:predicted O-linked N-acetylglucosamine transferase (SPINDLY family)